MTTTTNHKIIVIIDDAELALEIQRKIEQDREDQFVLEQMMELDGHNNKQEDWNDDKKSMNMEELSKEQEQQNPNTTLKIVKSY
jgi:hypothetical protein